VLLLVRVSLVLHFHEQRFAQIPVLLRCSHAGARRRTLLIAVVLPFYKIIVCNFIFDNLKKSIYLLLTTMQMQTPTAATQIRPEIIGTITVGSMNELECCEPGRSGIMSGRTISTPK
jgi:hypothetical protein